MKIRVLPRSYFERIKGSALEEFQLTKCKIISIESSYGTDSVPPFSGKFLYHPHLLTLIFDDVTDEKQHGCTCFTSAMAEQIFRFADDGKLQILIHCSAGISRSGAVGEVLDWYFNRYITDNESDHQTFLRLNGQIQPNTFVRRKMLEFLRSN